MQQQSNLTRTSSRVRAGSDFMGSRWGLVAELCLALADALLNKGEPAGDLGVVRVLLSGALQASQRISVAV